jgi:hypothetical protein
MDDEAQETWYRMLSGYSDEQVGLAIIHVSRSVKAFPSLAHIIESIEKASQVTALEAWKEAKEKAFFLIHPTMYADRETGELVQKPISWSDPVIGEVVKAIGAAHIHGSDYSQYNTLFSQFERTYNDMKQKRNIQDLAALSSGSDAGQIKKLFPQVFEALEARKMPTI